jgi:uncharacterized protein (TIGR02145 family)
MRGFVASMAVISTMAVLSIPSGIRADSFAGIVTDPSGNPLFGAGVALALAGTGTSSNPNGLWSISTGSAGIASRRSEGVPLDGHLVLERNRLQLRFDGRDCDGRSSNPTPGAIHESLPRTANNGATARSTVAVPDTLLFSWNGRVRLRVPALPVTVGALQSIDTSTTDADIPWASGIRYGSVTDSRDGKVYKTVVVGSQTWMAENLNYSGNGDSTVGLWYDNSADSGAKYGRLYTWVEVMNGAVSSSASPSGVRGSCPTDWHVPSDSEWTSLQTFSGKTYADGSTDATSLRATRGWPPGTFPGNGTDVFGFRALPGGNRGTSSFYDADVCGYWWSASEHDPAFAWFRYISGSDVTSNYLSKQNAFSLRCVKDP